MATPLLTYAVSTDPIPLQVSSAGALTIVANNLDHYSDQPTEDFVEVTSIVITLGASGTGADELTSNPDAIVVTPPTSLINKKPVAWSVARDGTTFTFTPPAQTAKPGCQQKTQKYADVSPNTGLSFRFSGIPVNDNVGTVNLSIAEMACSPGDPNNTTLFPALPYEQRVGTLPVGKFPKNFAVGDLIGCAVGVTPCTPSVTSGGAVLLSWSGSPASYALTYGKNITHHADGTALQPTDTYPNTAHSDPPLTLTEQTTFLLTVRYTPPGSKTPLTVQRERTIIVTHTDPVIESFSVTPALFPVSGFPAEVTLGWQVQHGRAADCVGFEVTPPLPYYPCQGSGLTHSISAEQTITLTAYGADGTTPATASRNVSSGKVVGSIKTTNSAYPPLIFFCPDNSSALLLGDFTEGEMGDYDTPVSVLEMTGTDPTKWAITPLAGVTGSLLDVPAPDSFIAVSTSHPYVFIVDVIHTPNCVWVIDRKGTDPAKWTCTPLALGQMPLYVATSGQYAFVTTMGNPSTLLVLEIQEGTAPDKWTQTPLTAQNAETVWADPQGEYIFVESADSQEISVIEMKGTDPTKWTATTRSEVSGVYTFSPDGQYAFMMNEGDDHLFILEIQAGVTPDKWALKKRTDLGGADMLIRSVYVSPDSKYVFVSTMYSDGNSEYNHCYVLEIQASATPDKWPLTLLVQQERLGFGGIFVSFSQDSQFAFLRTSASNFKVVTIDTQAKPEAWHITLFDMDGVPLPPCVTADGQYALVWSQDSDYKWDLSVIELTPAARQPTSPSHQP